MARPARVALQLRPGGGDARRRRDLAGERGAERVAVMALALGAEFSPQTRASLQSSRRAKATVTGA